MSEWTSLIVSVAAFLTAIAALIAPIIETRMTYKRDVTLKTMEQFHSNFTNIYREFCESYGALVEDDSPKAKQRFCGAAYAAALIAIENENYREFYSLALFVEGTGKSISTDEAFRKCLMILVNERKKHANNRKN